MHREGVGEQSTARRHGREPPARTHAHKRTHTHTQRTRTRRHTPDPLVRALRLAVSKTDRLRKPHRNIYPRDAHPASRQKDHLCVAVPASQSSQLTDFRCWTPPGYGPRGADAHGAPTSVRNWPYPIHPVRGAAAADNPRLRNSPGNPYMSTAVATGALAPDSDNIE